jgi:hypothetical protein
MSGRKPSVGRGAVNHAGAERNSAQAAKDGQQSLSPNRCPRERQTELNYNGEDFFDTTQVNDRVTAVPEGVVCDAEDWDDPNQGHAHKQQHGSAKSRQETVNEDDNARTENSALYEMEEVMDVADAGQGEWKKVRENKKRKIDQSPIKNNQEYISESESGVLSPGVSEATGAKSKVARKSNFTGVANATMRSDGNGKTIIVKAIGANANSFLKDPVGLAKGFKNSTFATVKAEMRVNSRRNVVAVELNQKDEELIKELVKTKKIGKWEVMCYQPGSDLGCSGVIGPIDKEADLEELQELMEADGGQTIVGVTRLNQFKGGFKEESLAIKVNFEGKVLPSKIMVGMLAFSVRAYLPPPLRCYRCQRLGHIADGCTAAFRCLVCAGNHSIKDGCTTNFLKCANCGGQHKASSGKCPFIIKSNEVRGLSITEGISIREAERLTSAKYNGNKIINKNLPIPQQMDRQGSSIKRVEVEVDFHHVHGSQMDSNRPYNRSYASVTQGKRGVVTGTEIESCRNIHSKEVPYEQTNEWDQVKRNNVTERKELDVKEITNIIEKVVNAKMEELIIRIGKMLKEIFMLNLQNEGQKQRNLLVQSVIRNNMGRETEEETIEQEESVESDMNRKDSMETVKTNNQRTTTRGRNNSGGKGTKTKSQERQRGKKVNSNGQ